jgi:hypothetical protein
MKHLVLRYGANGCEFCYSSHRRPGSIMASPVRDPEIPAPHPHSVPASDAAKAVILSELEKILESPPFRGSSRRKEFLSYVVRHSLDGGHEFLKERIIGAEVFHRDADYATGDDPVVRVQAGEVRRRLEQYYYTAPPDLPVRIEIPLGSYCPAFHWNPAPVDSHQAHPATIPVSPPDSVTLPAPQLQEVPKAARRHKWAWTAGIGALILVLAVAGIVLGLRSHKYPVSQLGAFWSPVFQSSQPVIICLAKPVVYRPSDEIYQRYARNHPGTFQTEAERDNEALPLDPSERITWGDIQIYPGYGVASGDTFAAVQISNLLVRMGKPSQVRIGSSYSFEDLRTSPAVVLGAFNNRWTMQMTSNLHFELLYNVGIREQIPGGRLWASEYDPKKGYAVDYGVVSRLLDAKSGQFLVTAAGIGSPGTQAAGELISNPAFLEELLRTAPPEWSHKNMQAVVQTNVIDSVPGPPHVVASYFW